MDKTFTLKIFKRFSKALLVTVIVCVLAFIQQGKANPVTVGLGIQAKSVKCYPNPAISFVNFEFPAEYVSKNYIIQVYSFTGKKMYEVNVNAVKMTVTFTNDFYRGIYIYQLQDKSGKILETGKFQVTR